MQNTGFAVDARGRPLTSVCSIPLCPKRGQTPFFTTDNKGGMPLVAGVRKSAFRQGLCTKSGRPLFSKRGQAPFPQEHFPGGSMAFRPYRASTKTEKDRCLPQISWGVAPGYNVTALQAAKPTNFEPLQRHLTDRAEHNKSAAGQRPAARQLQTDLPGLTERQLPQAGQDRHQRRLKDRGGRQEQRRQRNHPV
jgi:hypothetical protein